MIYYGKGRINKLLRLYFAFFTFFLYYVTMKEIKPIELNENPFKLIGEDWFLVAAEKEGRVNMLTASWGQVGVMWGKPVVNIFPAVALYKIVYRQWRNFFSVRSSFRIAKCLQFLRNKVRSRF